MNIFSYNVRPHTIAIHGYCFCNHIFGPYTVYLFYASPFQAKEASKRKREALHFFPLKCRFLIGYQMDPDRSNC